MSGPYRTSGVLPRLQENQRVLVGHVPQGIPLREVFLPSDPAVRAAIYFIIALVVGFVAGVLWAQHMLW